MYVAQSKTKNRLMSVFVFGKSEISLIGYYQSNIFPKVPENLPGAFFIPKDVQTFTNSGKLLKPIIV